MSEICAAQLIEIMPYAKARVPIYLDWLNHAMREFSIFSVRRQAAFLAQLAHESGELRYVREIYAGEKYDVGSLAERLGNTPEDDGDGEHHRGAGLIQLTGKRNQSLCALHFGLAVEEIVEWLQRPEGACRSAGWFWSGHGLNELADRHAFESITRRINGGLNGYHERLRYWARACKALHNDVPGAKVFEAFYPVVNN